MVLLLQQLLPLLILLLWQQSLTQQVNTAQYVDTVSKNVSLTLATKEVIDRKLEIRVDALEEAIMHIGTELESESENGSFMS